MKPRVVVVTTYYHPVVGGVETHARQLVAYLTRAGCPVHVITKRVEPQLPDEAVVDDARLHRVGPTGVRRPSGKWVLLPALFARLLSLRDQFDVIVCIDYRAIGIVAIAVGRLLRCPVIAQGETAGVLASSVEGSNSGLQPESAVVRLLKAPLRAVYRHADHVVCIGRDLEREAIAAGLPRDRVHYLPHGVDLDRFHPPAPNERERIRSELGWPVDRRIVLFVGRLSVEKGVMDLLEAWRLADRRDALLALVGPDMTGHRWDAGAPGRAFVAAHGLGDRVRFEGPTADPAPFYRGADVFVQPSHFEALGNTAIEAMATGLPVVTSGVGGLGDFCVDGRNALLHEPRSPESLARAVGRLLDDSPLRMRLADAARQTAADRFELGALLNRYEGLIAAAVRRR
jgi:glycosyltransferase involved in cell wall biosynthesis